ncbi:MAG TPA: enoyl-CoA hydratase-related protein [Dermatophilaceae bacterium]
MSEVVRFEVEGGIGTIHVQRPPMNALNFEVQDGLHAAAREATTRRDVSAVIVYGGEKVFAAGADVKEMQTMSYTDMVDRSAALQAAFTAIARIPKPTLAAVCGYALGAGCELALTCDFRVVADNSQLGLPEVLLGVVPGAGGTQRLPRLIGPARAKDLIFTGRFVSAQEALQIGMVDEVVAPGEVYAAARRRAERYVGGPAYAIRAAKEAIDRGLDVDLETGLEIERMQFAGVFATRDRDIGMASFVQRGPGKAVFEGR